MRNAAGIVPRDERGRAEKLLISSPAARFEYANSAMRSVIPGPSRRRVELLGARAWSKSVISTLALDFDVQLARKNGVAPDAVVLFASPASLHDMLLEIRSRTDAPALVLLDEAGPADRVLALEAGADDVLVAPYDASEMLARLRAIMRRTIGPDHEKFRVENLDIDVPRRTVRRGEKLIYLSRTELALLTTLARHEGTVVPHEMLTRQVWGTSKSMNTVHTFMSYLRAKVDPPGEVPLIHSVRGVGYVLRKVPED
ncbi:MAG TPA: response regulator transcription factor [Candidatus Elarobacter sp.]|jgi:DNA-binding response OmpR family regulator